MKRMSYLCLIVGILFSSVAIAADDYKSYCKEIAKGSYQIEETCRKQENEARSNLKKMSIPSDIRKHCRNIAKSSVGFSYSIMETCVKQELGSKGRLENADRKGKKSKP